MPRNSASVASPPVTAAPEGFDELEEPARLAPISAPAAMRATTRPIRRTLVGVSQADLVQPGEAGGPPAGEGTSRRSDLARDALPIRLPFPSAPRRRARSWQTARGVLPHPRGSRFVRPAARRG